MRYSSVFAYSILLCVALTAFAQEGAKNQSVLYSADIAARVRQNVAGDAWAAKVRDNVVAAAEFWRAKSDDELWSLMFGPTLERSWMVWSNGYSPITQKPVPMYNWVMDAQNQPWKVQDPTSGEWFPKNDFKAYYDSGLDERGVFDAARANRALLFNAEHPDSADPLHMFGVDDGSGYVNEKGERWRFIAAYLIYGQWKQLVIAGVRIMGAAYVLTADPVYAHKCGVLLDRIADLYPEFDFKTQGVLYEGPAVAGYVSTWHDTCEETRELVMAYDMVFDGLRDDTGLVEFLSKKAAEVKLDNPKKSFPDIQRNIETRILRDALAHPEKIYSNYPRAEICKAITVAVLQEPKEAFWALVDPMIERATAVDGVTGEKGLAGYSSFTISALASFLSEFSKADPTFLKDVLARYPKIHDTYRFHIDTLCLNRYYPLVGDCGHFAGPTDTYVGVNFLKPGESLNGWSNWTLLPPSNYRLLWDLYAITGDTAFVQIMYRANEYKIDELPYDIYGENPPAFRDSVANVIRQEGTLIPQSSVNKQQWRLAILRSGHGANARALWMDYDTGGGHSHWDGMNIGLFAHGLDLMPDYGYPPVQYGGWGSPRSVWYTRTAAHNTILVDEKNQTKGVGETTLWMDTTRVHALRASGATMAPAERFERTIALVDIDEQHFYIVDVFQVRGGHTHAKFQQSHFGELATSGLNLAPAGLFSDVEQMRNFRLDPAAPVGWQADWQIEDRYKLLTPPATVGMRYRDFTTGAAAGTSEAWIVTGSFDQNEETWIPRVIVHRTNAGETALVSTFVAVIEPWRDQPYIQSVKRLSLKGESGAEMPDTEVALEVQLADGRRDLVLLRDAERLEAEPTSAFGEPSTATDASLAVVRISSAGAVQYVAIGGGTTCAVNDFSLHRVGSQSSAEFNEK